ncbi:MAG: GNAT family N-acetyltransferase [Anaerotignum sp.]|nr:GNAT family N-acetyltransferase [Anaerotignum sp.]
MKFVDLFDADGIFLKTPNYILRRIAAEEKPYYEELARAEHPEIPYTSNAPLVWADLISEDDLLTCSILQRDTGVFCGFCQLQHIFSATPELGIDLLPAYQHSGIAAEILPLFLVQAKKILQNEYFYSKIKKANIPSQKLAEKIGGIYIGEKNLLPADFPDSLRTIAEKEFPDFFYLEYEFY